MAPLYGQVVAGPPGSGKTTYCNGMQQYLRLLGRDAAVINLDPANEVGASSDNEGQQQEGADDKNGKNSRLPYDAIFDVCEDVVNLSSVMQQLDLGPNGGLIYCMEYLETHVDDIIKMIRDRVSDKSYLIIDLPGQVELYTHSTCVQMLLQRLVKVLDLRLTAVQLIDAQYCTDATKFISAALLGTTAMIRLELPMVSVLSKVDILAKYGDLPLGLEFFTECFDLHRLVPFLDTTGDGDSAMNQNLYLHTDEHLDYVDDPDYIKARQKTRQSPFYKKREKLHLKLAEVIEEFGLLAFMPLDISSAESVGRVLAKVDKCNGYIFTESLNVTEDMFQCAIQSDFSSMHLTDIQERLEYEREIAAKNAEAEQQI